MLKKHPWKIIIGVAALLLAASFYWSSSAGEKANDGVVLGSHTKGNADSTVKLVEYSDFQCPACGDFYYVVKDILDEYGDSIGFEYKNFPLLTIHQFALPAAKAAEAAGQQGKFFAMHDKLFENQAAWSTAANPQAFFVQYAEEIGLDVDLFKKHMRASMIEDKIKSEFNEARDLGLTGTPSFFLNGKRMQFDTYESFKNQIDVAVNGESDTTEIEPVTATSDVKFGI